MVYGFIAEPWPWDPGSYLTHEQYSGVQWAGTLHPQPQERGAQVGLLKPGGEKKSRRLPEHRPLSFIFWYTQCYPLTVSLGCSRCPIWSFPFFPFLPTWLCLRFRVAAVMVSTATLGLDPSGFPLWEVAAASTPASSHRLRMGRGLV